MFILSQDRKTLQKAKYLTVSRNIGGGKAGRFCIASSGTPIILAVYETEEEAQAELARIADAIAAGEKIYRCGGKEKSAV